MDQEIVFGFESIDNRVEAVRAAASMNPETVEAMLSDAEKIYRFLVQDIPAPKKPPVEMPDNVTPLR